MSNNIKIKNTDLVLSNIGFGTVNAGLAWDNEDAFEILERYIKLGGNVIDCARIYSDWVEPEIGRAERVIGDWIKHRGKRYDLVIKKEKLADEKYARILEIVKSSQFKNEIDGLGGYDTKDTGKIMAIT